MSQLERDKSRPYQVIGTSPIRPDALDKVTGRAVYGPDFSLPGMLAGAVLRSPLAHARILAVDTRLAEAQPGVRAVITALDLPDAGSDTHLRQARMAILALGKALYAGQPVAAVAAENLETAQQALNLIQVSYETLPAVLDGRQATQPGAPLLHEDLGPGGNLADHFQTRRGDVARGFAAADVVIEREFYTSAVHQGYLEPLNATAIWSADGQLTVWCSTQGAFGVRDQLAEILDLPPGQIRVIPLEIGGGFGGKNTVYLEPLAALLSRKASGQPVKLVMTRAEVLAASGPTSASTIRVKLGATRSGRLTAAEASLVYEAGAFPGSPLWGGMGSIFSQYTLEHALIDGYDVVVNKTQASTYRAPGAANALFAAESVVDELAGALGIDPLELRRMNAVRQGDSRPDGSVFGPIGCLETIQQMLDSPHYRAPLPPAQPGHATGRGVASAYWGNGGGTSSATARLEVNGSIHLVMGSVDLAAIRIVVTMQLAETLGLPVSAIHTEVGDTLTVGFTEGSYGSRSTVATGLAAYRIGCRLIEVFRQAAADHWGAALQDVSYRSGTLAWRDQELSLTQLAAGLAPGEPLQVSLTSTAEGWAPGFAVHLVDVDVDCETGQVRLLRYTAVQDVGTAVHPDYLVGQIQGGVVQGIGWALCEGYIYDDQGRLLNDNLANYRLPLSVEAPPIEVVLVQTPNPHHPYGVRGAGEIPIVPPAAAIANAIYHAAGARLDTLPMTPERVLAALEKKTNG